jgi:hypothetical protein
MVRSDDPTARALELARSATPATAQRRTALAAVAKPAAEVQGSCWWRSCVARAPGRPRSAWHDRWHVG